MPQAGSLLGTLAVTVLVFLGSQASPVVGYLVALLALVMIVVAMYMGSIWPTRANKENPLVFSLFWGLMIGAIAPFLIATYLQGGVAALYEIFTSTP